MVRQLALRSALLFLTVVPFDPQPTFAMDGSSAGASKTVPVTGGVYDSEPSSRDVYRPYRVGFNFIRTTSKAGGLSSASKVMSDISQLNGQGIRQLGGSDLGWFTIANSSVNRFDFTNSDSYLLPDNSNIRHLFSIPTLFVIGPNSQQSALGSAGDPSCDDDSKQTFCKVPYTPSGDQLKLSKSDVEDQVTRYVDAVGAHYKGTGVTHFEVFNEMERFHSSYACINDAFVGFWSFSPSDYVSLLKFVRGRMQRVDSRFRTLMAGLWYGDDTCRQDKTIEWLKGFLAHGGNDLTPAINFHYYGEWYNLRAYIQKIKDALEKKNVSRDRALWMTEVGRSYVETSETGQAQSLFKFFSVGFGNGVRLANWHTHVSSKEAGSWAGYGVRKSSGEKVTSWNTYQLFANKLGNFGSCTELKYDVSDVYVYKYSGSLYSDWPRMSAATFVAWLGKDASKAKSIEYLVGSDTGWKKARVTNTVTLTETVVAMTSKVTLTDQPILIEKAE